MNRSVDLLIIGAGFAGLTSAIYAKRSGLDVLVVEKSAPGGKLNSIAKIENYPGVGVIDGPTLAMNIFNQASELKVDISFENVLDVRKEEHFVVTTDESQIVAKAIIVATGTLAKELNIKGEIEFKGKGISYCAVCDGSFFKNKAVAVIGNKDIAIEEAIYLSSLASKVYLISPDNTLQGIESHNKEVSEKENIEIFYSTNIIAIEGDKTVSKVLLKNQNEFYLPVDGVFPYIGEKSSTSFLSSLNVNSLRGYILTNESMETNVPGLFAAGDIVSKKLRQLVTASSDGAIASLSANKYIKSIK